MTPGFADPVLDSQACFRAVLDAMARPGTVHVAHAPPPPGLDAATAAVLLTLVDIETPVWIEGGVAAEWVGFHCGAPATTPERAAFAVVRGALDLSMFGAGSDEAPEDGATVIVQVAGIVAQKPSPAGGRGLGGGGVTGTADGVGGPTLTPTLSRQREREQTFMVRGPGIETTATLHITGLPDDFTTQWATNRTRFPRGVDLILCAGDRIAALPRTVEIT